MGKKLSEEGATKKPEASKKTEAEKANAQAAPRIRRPTEPFGPEKRAAYLRFLKQGQSRSTAANLAGVARSCVKEWVASGKSDKPRHPEHAKFAKEVDEAMAQHRAWAYRNAKKHAKEDARSSISLLNQIDDRFGGPQRVRAIELANEQKELEIRMLRVRAQVAEAAASGTGEVPGFGLAGLLGDEELPVELRQAVAAWAVRRGYVAVERLDWGRGT